MKNFCNTLKATCLTASLALVGCTVDVLPSPLDNSGIHTISVDNTAPYEIPANGEIEISFTVEASDEPFDYNITSAGRQISLQETETHTTPHEFTLVNVKKGSTVGQYIASLRDTGSGKEYCYGVCLSIKVNANKEVFSNTFYVQSTNYISSLATISFLKSKNPTLKKDIFLTYDTENNRFTGATDDYLTSLNLIATFDFSGADRVEIDGEAQTSGVTSNDFKKEVTYKVYWGASSGEYRVKLINWTGLPVVTINTVGGVPITDKENWLEAKMTIDGAGEFDDFAESTIYIRGRGNTTWTYWPKKPYAIKLDSKEKVLGMKKHKRWVLLANAMDRTLLRNRVAYYLAQQTSLAWTPHSEYAELFLNGKHLGQYLLTEQVKVDKNRINITEMSANDNSGDAVTGGYLLELDFHYDNVWQWRGIRNTPFAVKYPDEEDLTDAQWNWIRNYIYEVETTLYGSSYTDPTNGYRKYIDPQSFVDYYLIYELTVNHELGNPGSVYIYKDRNGKLFAGPTWDFDWGTFSYNASPQAQWGVFMQGAWWYARLFQDAEFKKLVGERWRELKPKFETALDFIDHEHEYIRRSSEINFQIWDISTDTNGDERLTQAQAIDRMYKILKERIVLLDNTFSKY